MASQISQKRRGLERREAVGVSFGSGSKGMAAGPPTVYRGDRPILNGNETILNPAYRSGAQQSGKLRVVDDLERSSTKEAATVHSPINLPS